MATEIPRVIAVSSGKGGVGKTNVVANLALYFSSLGKKVLVLDADLGLSNIDVLLGIAPKYNIRHVIKGEKSMEEIIVEGPGGISIIPASSGIKELTSLSDTEKLKLISELDNIKTPFDLFLIDTGAGINMNVLFFCVASQELVVLVTPEPTSIADGYALIKVLLRDFGEKNFKILVNNAKNEREAVETFNKLSIVAERFLNLSLDYLGFLPFEKRIKDAIVAQKGFINLYPNSNFSRILGEVGARLLGSPPAGPVKGNVQFFLKKALEVS